MKDERAKWSPQDELTQFEQHAEQIERTPVPPRGDVFVAHLEETQPRIPEEPDEGNSLFPAVESRDSHEGSRDEARYLSYKGVLYAAIGGMLYECDANGQPVECLGEIPKQRKRGRLRF